MFKKLFVIFTAVLFVGDVAVARVNVPEESFYISSLNDVLETALQNEGVRPPLKVEEVFLMKEGEERVIRPDDAETLFGWNKFTLAKFELNEITNRFMARVVTGKLDKESEGLKSSKNAISTLTIRGKVVKLEDIPVLAHNMNKGEVIGEGDVDWVEYPKRKVRPSFITDIDSLIGYTPRYRLLANKAIKARDVISPIVIEKGDAVTILYRTAYVRLQTLGYAIEDGKKGALIGVRNARSKKVVQAIVKEKGLVVINSKLNKAEMASSEF